MAKIAILGFGTVGSGVYEVPRRNAAGVSPPGRGAGRGQVYPGCKGLPDRPDAHLFVKNIDVILADPEVRAVVETIGGTRFAYPYVKACLESGRSVATSNKRDGGHLWCRAAGSGPRAWMCFCLRHLWAAAPHHHPMHQCLAANVITQVQGIVNGTTNFMPPRWPGKAWIFDAALKIAQQLGYAETRTPATMWTAGCLPQDRGSFLPWSADTIFSPQNSSDLGHPDITRSGCGVRCQTGLAKVSLLHG